MRKGRFLLKKILLLLWTVCTLTIGGSFAASANGSEVEPQFATCFFTIKNKTEVRSVPITEKGRVQYVEIPASSVPAGTDTVEIHHPAATARAGDPGFYVFCDGMYGVFKKREKNGTYSCGGIMQTFGVKTPLAALSVIITGMPYNARHCVEYKNGVYRIFPRFNLEGDKPGSNIKVEFHLLDKNASYADMARTYRNYQLQRGACVPLKDRVKNRPELKYAAESMEIRVRMGWKPVPSPVGEQTAENEPPMKTAITFDRFKDIVDEFKKQGIKKAEFCLVGWNTKGHDGRYPQIFPVEEQLGGETKLRQAIQKAQKEGYQIVCHTNSHDAYSVSRIGGRWDENYLLIPESGKIKKTRTWSGGNVYFTCPKCVYNRFVREDLARLREIGFRGLHYMDVYTVFEPHRCWSKDHPLSREEYVDWVKKIFQCAQNEIGGFASEGGWDFGVAWLDYSLYVSFHDPCPQKESDVKKNRTYNPVKSFHPLIDRHTPFWQLVYNGIVLNNPYSVTTNYTIKDKTARLKLVEFGGRPVFYFYSKFLADGGNWMGETDITSGTDRELTESVRNIKRGYDEFEKLKDLQYEFMDRHDMIAENVFRTGYSDGTEIIVNYGEKPFLYKNKNIPPMAYIKEKSL